MNNRNLERYQNGREGVNYESCEGQRTKSSKESIIHYEKKYLTMSQLSVLLHYLPFFKAVIYIKEVSDNKNKRNERGEEWAEGNSLRTRTKGPLEEEGF